MTLLAGSDSLNTAFSPTAGDFIVQVSGGVAILQRRNDSGSAWVDYARLDAGHTVPNPVSTAQYRFRSDASGIVVRADQ